MIVVIPAIDIIDGKCVRLTQGDFSQKTEYGGDPAETALRFRDAGLSRLHVVDLDGARIGKPRNLSTLERVAAASGMVIDYGGGIRTDEDVAEAFSAGASIVNVGSIAVKQPDKFISWAARYGAERFLLGADARNGLVTTNGWTNDTDVPVSALLQKYARLGITNVFVTDVARDGMLAGPAIDLYRQIRKALPEISLIASGGVRSMEDVDGLAAIGCDGAIIGKALYEGGITLTEIAEYVGKKNNTVS